jgi:hypothetical protein
LSEPQAPNDKAATTHETAKKEREQGREAIIGRS